ncbi:hypothetical protein NC651_014430 [Populus alba x Populus x berolinensis]|nr:hypothetical protein NC651_014430 [Populus alba x Populus x berolinensis]
MYCAMFFDEFETTAICGRKVKSSCKRRSKSKVPKHGKSVPERLNACNVSHFQSEAQDGTLDLKKKICRSVGGPKEKDVWYYKCYGRDRIDKENFKKSYTLELCSRLMDLINRGYDDFEQKIMDDHAGIKCVEDAVSMLKLRVYILEFRLDESTRLVKDRRELLRGLKADVFREKSNHHATPCEGPYLGLGSLCWAWRFKSQWAFNHLPVRVDQLPKQSLLKKWAIFSTALVLMGHNLIAEGGAPGLLHPSHRNSAAKQLAEAVLITESECAHHLWINSTQTANYHCPK